MRKHENSGNPSEGLIQQVAIGAIHRRDIPVRLASMSAKMTKRRAVIMTSSQAKSASGYCQMAVIMCTGEKPWCLIHSPNAAKGRRVPAKPAKRYKRVMCIAPY